MQRTQTVPISITSEPIGVKNLIVSLEVNMDGSISGKNLMNAILAAVQDKLTAKGIRDLSIVQIFQGKQQVRSEKTYTIANGDTFTIDFAGRPKQAEGQPADSELVELVRKNATNYSIGSYLLGRPGMRDALEQQQYLGQVIEALEKRVDICVVLIDKNFSEPHNIEASFPGQIVAFLKAQDGTAVTQIDSHYPPDIRVFQVKTYHNVNVKGRVQIIYVGRNSNEATTQALKDTGIPGGWYSTL